MYTLADYIGEDKVDLALQNFLMQYRYANANNQVDAADSSHSADQPSGSSLSPGGSGSGWVRSVRWVMMSRVAITCILRHVLR